MWNIWIFANGFYEDGFFTLSTQTFVATSTVEFFGGGAGADTVDYGNSTALISVNLSTNVNTGGFAQGDTLISMDNVLGSDYSDHLTGDSQNNTLIGRDGDDKIDGGDGNDVLSGGAGNDLIKGGAGADTIYGGDGDDTLHGHSIDAFAIQSVLAKLPGMVYNEDSNSFYYIPPAFFSISWANAQAILSNVTFNGAAGHLANVTSVEEYHYLTELSDGRAMLLGGSDGAKEGTFAWDSGAEAGAISYSQDLSDINMYQDFHMGVPYRAMEDGATNTDALLMYGYQKGGWVDVDPTVTGDANESYGVIAEWDAGMMLDDNAADVLNGGRGNDTSYGYGGDDLIDSGEGDDVSFGGEGNDVLLGRDGNDNLYGQNGDDWINSGKGADIVDGGEGADAHVFDAATAFHGVDTILGFDTGEGDFIDISDIIGYDPLFDAIEDFVQITDDGTSSFVAVDANGGGDAFETIAMIVDVTGLTNEALLEIEGALATV